MCLYSADRTLDLRDLCSLSARRNSSSLLAFSSVKGTFSPSTTPAPSSSSESHSVLIFGVDGVAAADPNGVDVDGAAGAGAATAGATPVPPLAAGDVRVGAVVVDVAGAAGAPGAGAAPAPAAASAVLAVVVLGTGIMLLLGTGFVVLLLLPFVLEERENQGISCGL